MQNLNYFNYQNAYNINNNSMKSFSPFQQHPPNIYNNNQYAITNNFYFNNNNNNVNKEKFNKN